MRNVVVALFCVFALACSAHASSYDEALDRMIEVAGIRDQMVGSADALGDMVGKQLRQSPEDVPERFINIYVEEFKAALVENIDDYMTEVRKLYKETLTEEQLVYLTEVYSDPRWKDIQGKLMGLMVRINEIGGQFGERVANLAAKRAREKYNQ